MVVCVECGRDVIRLFRDYGNHNIRLRKCEHCGAIADKYIELDAVNILLEMLLLKEPVYRHAIFNSQDYAVNSRNTGCVQPKSPMDLSPSYVFDSSDSPFRMGSDCADFDPFELRSLNIWNKMRKLRWDVLRSMLVMAVSDIFVKMRTTPSIVNRMPVLNSSTTFMERLDYILHKILFSQVVLSKSALAQSWSYMGIAVAAMIELFGFLAAITAGVIYIRNPKDSTVMRLNAWDIGIAAGVSQLGKVAPVILMIWSAAPDIRLAVASFNLSTCVVVVKLTSGRKGVPALMVVLFAVMIRLIMQWSIARWYNALYPCSIISAFG